MAHSPPHTLTPLLPRIRHFFRHTEDGDYYENAVYAGNNMMFYGSGRCDPKDWLGGCPDSLKPLTSLGVTAHELSHGVTASTSNLNYVVGVVWVGGGVYGGACGGLGGWAPARALSKAVTSLVGVSCCQQPDSAHPLPCKRNAPSSGQNRPNPRWPPPTPPPSPRSTRPGD